MPDPTAPKVKWTIVVEPSTDMALRRVLAARGTRKGDLSRFVEDAVRQRIVQLSREPG
ncbi:ribbon-helix-helix domain-containing protein [Novosphingobium sp. B 225]|uniref:ribbon-helix-helix domain-containing protein n=1 Tax=Novosphingobium sp. B 225 TaxID=1961849 RepID=UPI000B4C0A58|nr:ribbon-helix-helix domain-containing protein [Novosphingobium sp. B 225]